MDSFDSPNLEDVVRRDGKPLEVVSIDHINETITVKGSMGLEYVSFANLTLDRGDTKQDKPLMDADTKVMKLVQSRVWNVV